MQKSSHAGKKGVAPKLLGEERCEIKGGNQEISSSMAKNLIIIIHVKLVPSPWRKTHKFTWIVDIKIFALE